MIVARRAGALLCGASVAIVFPTLTGCAPGRAYSIAMVDPGGTQTVITPARPAGTPSASVAGVSTAVLPGALPAQRTLLPARIVPVTLITRSGATVLAVTRSAGANVATVPVPSASVAVASAKSVKAAVTNTVSTALAAVIKPVRTSVHAGVSVTTTAIKPVPARLAATQLASVSLTPQASPLATIGAAVSTKAALGSVDTSVALAAPTPGVFKPTSAVVAKLAKGHGKPHG